MGSLKELKKDIVVVTSKYVLENSMPILYVSNDDDEEGGSLWQFHCDNGDYDMEKMLLVSIDTILKIDESLEVLNLKIGEEARRESKEDTWKVIKQSP